MMRAKRGLSAIYAAWAVMATSALSAHAAETKRTPQAAVPQAAPAALPSEPRAAVDFMIRRFEGTGLGDNGHGLSRYGIVGWVNGLSSRGVARLSYGGGAAILERNYWDAVDAGRLPASMRFIAFDAVRAAARAAADCRRAGRSASPAARNVGALRAVGRTASAPAALAGQVAAPAGSAGRAARSGGAADRSADSTANFDTNPNANGNGGRSQPAGARPARTNGDRQAPGAPGGFSGLFAGSGCGNKVAA